MHAKHETNHIKPQQNNIEQRQQHKVRQTIATVA